MMPHGMGSRQRRLASAASIKPAIRALRVPLTRTFSQNQQGKSPLRNVHRDFTIVARGKCAGNVQACVSRCLRHTAFCEGLPVQRLDFIANVTRGGGGEYGSQVCVTGGGRRRKRKTWNLLLRLENTKKRGRVEDRNENGVMTAHKVKGVQSGDEPEERERNKSESSSRSQRRGCTGRGLVCGFECFLAGCDELDNITSGCLLKVEEHEKARKSVGECPRKLEERQVVILKRWVEFDGIKGTSTNTRRSWRTAGRGSSARRLL